MESLSPNIFVTDITATINFYKLLGFEVTMTVPEQGPDFVWVMMAKGNVTFMFQTLESLADKLPQISRADGASLLLYISVKDIRILFDQVKDKVTVLKDLETTFYGATEFSILDPNNYVLTFAEHQPHDNV
ncbi:VOC family protein [Mucilaginibacter glaciei]|uniref:VOC family protein n=1 Tax=Mucilaginibacter glaciei TaxID=2772109 RepID=A0A926S1B7_9SPHI|nr:VOC family protein [Mucilaginibacter glaciei]MBD1393850.1 VOC family protein [Mucilaginibacter glaciei]